MVTKNDVGKWIKIEDYQSGIKIKVYILELEFEPGYSLGMFEDGSFVRILNDSETTIFSHFQKEVRD